MTANTPEQQPQGAAPPPGPDVTYEVRLATRIPRLLDQRLRLLAAIRRQPITHVLAEVLARGLPTTAQLAEQLAPKTTATVQAILDGGLTPEDDGEFWTGLAAQARQGLADQARQAGASDEH